MEAISVENWAQHNNMLENKSVEIRIYLDKNSLQPSPLILGGKEVPVVLQSKYIEYPLNNQFNGNYHIDKGVKRASQLLQFLQNMHC